MILVNSKTIATMKNIFKSLMLVAVAAMGFACQEAMEENYTPTNPREVVMTIIADMDEETRTYISDEANGKIAWSADDKLKVIENSAVYRTSDAATIDADGKAQFSVSFPANTSDSEFTYNAVFPATALVEDDAEKIDAAKVKVIVNDQQKPTATSFDPKADILVSKQLEFDAQPTELNMQFKRLVALGKISLTNLPANEKISQVVFTAGANDILAGRNYVNATNGDVIEYGYYGKTNILTLNYDEAISTRDIYFTCNPFDMAEGDTFKVKVVCEDYTYTREVTIPKDRSLVFTEGDMTTFTVNMKDATIESSFVFADGVYAVIAKSSDKYYAMKGVKGSGNFMSHVEVSYDGAAATFTTDDKTLVWDIADVDGGYTFQNNEGKYLYWSSGNYSYLGDASKAQVMTITPIDGTSQYKVAVKDTPERILSYNASSPRFAFYGNTEQKYELYLVPVVADTTPRFTVDPMEFEFDAAGGDITFTTTSNEYLTTDISATDDADWLTISGSGNTFTATATENNATERSAKITFSAEGAESVVVTVTQKAAGSITDTLTRATTGITDTTYATWSGKTGESGAVYAGQSAGGNDAIQLRSNNSNSGIITTASGGKARKIVVVWNSSTTSGRTLDIYGKNEAYTNPSQLYNAETQGTKLGSIKYGTSTELTIEGDYAYIGLRSNSGAMYISSIEITWEPGDEPETPAVPSFSLDVDALEFGAEGGEKTITVTRTNTDAPVEAESDNGVFTVNVDGDKVTVKAAANELEKDVTGNITIKVGDLEETVVATLAAKPVEGGSEVVEKKVTFDFTKIPDFSSWTNSYSKHTVEYDDATVIFTSASKQGTTITNMPVTKGQPVEIKAKDGATMKSVKFTCAKWTTKTQTITLHYSVNGGTSYTSTGKTSTNFSIEHTDLPAGTNAVKITFSSSSNQVGIQQADVTFLN